MAELTVMEDDVGLDGGGSEPLRCCCGFDELPQLRPLKSVMIVLVAGEKHVKNDRRSVQMQSGQTGTERHVVRVKWSGQLVMCLKITNDYPLPSLSHHITLKGLKHKTR